MRQFIAGAKKGLSQGENGYRRRKRFIAAAKAVCRSGETAYRNSENEYRRVGTAYR